MIEEKVVETLKTAEDQLRQYRELKNQLADVQRHKKGKWLAIFFVALSLIFTCFAAITPSLQQYSFLSKVTASIVIGIVCGGLFALCVYLFLDIKESSIRREMIHCEAVEIERDASDDIFKNSIKMSYKYLDEYYLQTREHAQRGFRVTVGISIFGALLISGGIIGMFLGRVDLSYIPCASGVITEFVASIFFYLYNKTVSSMSQYHNKLVLSQDISIALKVADSLPTGDQAKVKTEIISELLKDINMHLTKEDSPRKTQSNPQDGSSALSK